jgi:hypothetical protein
MVLHIGNDTFVGMKSLVFNQIGNNVAIGVSSTITTRLKILDNKYILQGSIITTQQDVDKLPKRIGSPYENNNEEVIHINDNKLDEGYKELNIEKIIAERERKSNGTKYVRDKNVFNSLNFSLIIFILI